MINLETNVIREVENFNNYTTDLLLSLYPKFAFNNENIEENINSALTDPPYKDLRNQLSKFKHSIENQIQISIQINSENISKIYNTYFPFFSMTRKMLNELRNITKQDYIEFYSKSVNKDKTTDIEAVKEKIQNNQLTIKYFEDRKLFIQFHDYYEIIKEHVEICEIILNEILLYLNQYKQKEPIVTTLIKNDLLHKDYETDFNLLLNDELNDKIKYDNKFAHWKVWYLIVFFIDNGFVSLNNKPTEIKEYILKYFEYLDSNNVLKKDHDLKKLIEKYPSKLSDINYKRSDYLKKMKLFAQKNNFNFSLHS